MAGDSKSKTLGEAIDEVINALANMDDTSRLTVIRAACEHLSIPISHSKTQTTGETLISPMTSGIAQQGTPSDIRALKVQKAPSSAIEMACLIAYYLQALAPDSERKDTITTSDLETYYRHADYPLPKAMNQVLVDAKSAGYFDSKERGTYKLNAVGYNLVVHSLPRSRSQPQRAISARKASLDRKTKKAQRSRSRRK